LLKKNKSLVVDEEIVRRHLLYLDLEEEKLGCYNYFKLLNAKSGIISNSVPAQNRLYRLY